MNLISSKTLSIKYNSIYTTVTIETYSTSTGIYLCLINKHNCFDYYELHITESSFLSIKENQNLKIDYKNLLPILNLFLEKQADRKIEIIFSSDANENSNSLFFIEKNEIRNLILLELNLMRPEEEDFKKYLSRLIRKLEEENRKYFEQISSLRKDRKFAEQKFNETLRGNQNKNQQLEENYALQKNRWEKLQKNFSELEKNFNAVSEEKNKLFFENEKLKIDCIKNSKFSEENEQLQKKIQEYETDLKTANEIIKKIRGENRSFKDRKKFSENLKEEMESLKMKVHKGEEHKRQVRVLEGENRKLQSEVKVLEKENRELERKLENAQNIYSHFFEKRKDKSEIYPESPPR